MKQLFAGLSIFLVILLVMFIPLGIVYALIIHFTGQSYASLTVLILFMLFFFGFDMAAGTLIDSFLQAAKDLYRDLCIPKFIGVILELCGTFIVLSALDYFMDGIELSVFIKITIAIIHGIAGLFLESIETEDRDETVVLAPGVINDIHHHLKLNSWTDCVTIIHEKYPHIPKSDIIRAVRELYKKGSG